jgi:hypothetical protein
MKQDDGYVLYSQLLELSVDCEIVAPTLIAVNAVSRRTQL